MNESAITVTNHNLNHLHLQQRSIARLNETHTLVFDTIRRLIRKDLKLVMLQLIAFAAPTCARAMCGVLGTRT